MSALRGKRLLPSSDRRLESLKLRSPVWETFQLMYFDATFRSSIKDRMRFHLSCTIHSSSFLNGYIYCTRIIYFEIKISKYLCVLRIHETKMKYISQEEESEINSITEDNYNTRDRVSVFNRYLRGVEGGAFLCSLKLTRKVNLFHERAERKYVTKYDTVRKLFEA